MNYKRSKDLITKILQIEMKENNLNVEVMTVTNIENISDTIKTEIKKYKKDKEINIINLIENIKYELNETKYCQGTYYQNDNKIKIFLDKIKKDSDSNTKYLWKLLITTYHELKHAIIKNEDFIKRDNITNFYLLLDFLVLKISEYSFGEPKEYYEEILANNYGTKKSKLLLKEVPSLYKKLYKLIKEEELTNEFYTINYDSEKFINYISCKIKEDNQILENPVLEQIKIFLYNDDKKFKSLTELSKNDDWNKLPLEIKYSIIASRTYLNDINYNDITTEDIKFLLEALNYSYNIERIRTKRNSNLKLNINNIAESFKKDYPNFLSTKDKLLKEINKNQKFNKLKLERLKLEIEKITIILDNQKNNLNIKKLKK